MPEYGLVEARLPSRREVFGKTLPFRRKNDLLRLFCSSTAPLYALGTSSESKSAQHSVAVETLSTIKHWFLIVFCFGDFAL